MWTFVFLPPPFRLLELSFIIHLSIYFIYWRLTPTVCLNRPDYEEALDYEFGIENDEEYYNASGLGNEDREFEYPFLALKKLLSDGSFYYSLDFNLTDRLQDR